MRMKKIIPIFLGLLFVFLIVEILLLSPSDLDLVVDKKDGQGLMSNNASADQIMRGVHLMEASEGHREGELWSDTAISFKSANRWELEKVKVIFFSDKGDFTVTGKKGFINTDTKDLEVHGDVEVHSKNGYVFYTQKTNYISKQKKLISPTSVKMFGPKDERGFRMNLVGDGLESLVKTSFIEILGNVKAVKTVNKDLSMNIK